MPLASSTVMTPSLPTFCIASAIILPISASPLAEIVPTWAVSAGVVIFLVRFFSSSTTAVTALSMPRFRSIGFMPAATALAPSRTIACASTVAVVVPSPAMSLVLRGDFAHHLRAHVLELVGQLDFLGDGHAVLGDARRAEALVEDHVAALGAQRHLHGVGEDIHAAQHACAGVAAEAYVFGSHVCISSFISQLQISEVGPSLRGLLLRAAVPSMMPMMSDSFMISSSSPSILTSVPDHLPNRMRSPAFTSSATSWPCFVAGAGADGDDFAFHRLFLGGVGDDDAARGLFFGGQPPDHDPVVQGTEMLIRIAPEFDLSLVLIGSPHRRGLRTEHPGGLLALPGRECQRSSRSAVTCQGLGSTLLWRVLSF